MEDAPTAALKEGDRAPDFELQDAEGRTWRLSDLRGKKVIVYFYPTDDTPGCTAQACDFRDSQADLNAAGYTVLGVSRQSAQSHQKFINKYELNFPLLVDSDMDAARSYGVVKEKGVTRSTFVIDENGILTSVEYGVVARENVSRLRELLGV